jgi:hypothetical protein
LDRSIAPSASIPPENSVKLLALVAISYSHIVL